MACQGCYEKQLQIDRLTEQVNNLKVKLRYEEKKSQAGYFGSSTPSAQKPFKENSDGPKSQGGGKKGHKGYGREGVCENEADIIEYLKAGPQCPYCRGELEIRKTVNRSVIESDPIKAKKKLYKSEKAWCPKCRKMITPKPPVLPKSLYGNQLISQAVTMHYGHGLPVGRIENILGQIVPSGSLYDIFHRLADLWEPAMSKLIEEYREEYVKHADETGWRNNGHSGYSWLFCSKNISIFKFADNRSAQIPKMILGDKKLPGALVVDRYSGYNKVPCRIQYCYAHLLRHVEDLGKEFIDVKEVQCFVSVLAPLLSEAMHLRTLEISDRTYYKKALLCKNNILKTINSPATHLGIQSIQILFKENKNRLYLWCQDRRIPADNNRAERELRPTVIARKVSFGSQSDKGARTRSILMSILQTAQKRLKNQTLEDWFKHALDQIALNPYIDIYSLLPPPLS